MRIIGISGLKGSGKSEVARHLAENHGYRREKFATGLKTMLYGFLAYCGLDDLTIDRMIEGDLKEVATPYLAGRSPRHAMQTLGTEWGREQIGRNLWVGATVQRLSNIMRGANRTDSGVLVDDVRFENEAEAIRRLGGVILHVERPGLLRAAHESEQFEPAPQDWRIANDGTIADLRDNVDVAIARSGI